MQILFKQNLTLDGALIALIFDDQKLPKSIHDISNISQNFLKKKNFFGKEGDLFSTSLINNEKFTTLILVGLGNKNKLNDLTIQKATGMAITELMKTSENLASLITPDTDTKTQIDVNAAFAALLTSYKFDKYKTQHTEIKHKNLITLSIITDNPTKTKKAFAPLENLAKGIYSARDFISEPANILFPETFVKKAEKILPQNLEISVLNKNNLAKIGMNMILGVANGSQKDPRLLICKLIGNPKKKNISICIIGKGVCFDSGGLSLKPAQSMEMMKYDMAGAATALGLIQTLALNKANINIVAIIPLVENMPSGNAQKPGDVILSMSGKTVEVLNTDAEGRLILADAITYAQKEFKPETIIDIATLTGAIRISLGSEYAGIFSNDLDLSQKLINAGKKTGEKLWPFPMDDEYNDLLKSDIADIKNIADGGASSITAAKFLENFIEGKTKWAHIDIASVAWENKGKPNTPKGATAFGIKLLNQFISDNYL